MAATKLCGDNLRALRPLVLEALDYRQLRGVLADLIDEADPDLAGRLRRLQTYELTLRALDCGGYEDIVTKSKSFGHVLRYRADVAKLRRVAWWRPDEVNGAPYHYRLAERELCRLRECWCGTAGVYRYADLLYAARRSGHVEALVWRGLDGQAVPFDVEVGLAHLRNSIHFTVSQPMR